MSLITTLSLLILLTCAQISITSCFLYHPYESISSFQPARIIKTPTQTTCTPYSSLQHASYMRRSSSNNNICVTRQGANNQVFDDGIIVNHMGKREEYDVYDVNEGDGNDINTTTPTNPPTATPNTSHNHSRKELDVFILTFPKLYTFDIEEGDADNIYDGSNLAAKETAKQNPKISKYMQLLKRWKYYVLGDGGVYFDQRPKSLSRLNQQLLDVISKELGPQINSTIKAATSINSNIILPQEELFQNMEIECAVISTCKRFEILITMEVEVESSINNNNCTNIEKQHRIDIIKSIIASYFAKQITLQRRKLKLLGVIPFLAFPRDRPSRIKTISSNNSLIQQRQQQNEMYNELKETIHEQIIIVNGIQNVTKRLIQLASGLLDRPIFRPFSSRDSHIMFQLKKTSDSSQRRQFSYSKEEEHQSNNDTNDDELTNEDMGPNRAIIVTHRNNHNNHRNCCTKYSKILFDAALQGGKAARSPKVVPILNQLKEESKGADGPPQLSAKAAESAMILAVTPTVISCVERFKAMEATDRIVALRNDAKKIAVGKGIDIEKGTDDGAKLIRKLLHEPVTNLRRGNSIDVDVILSQIDDQTS